MGKPAKKLSSALGLGQLLGGELPTGVAGAVAKDQYGKLTDVPDVSLPAETAMPTPNDDAARAARRRRMLMNQSRSGRQSTLLSTTDTLG